MSLTAPILALRCRFTAGSKVCGVGPFVDVPGLAAHRWAAHQIEVVDTYLELGYRDADDTEAIREARAEKAKRLPAASIEEVKARTAGSRAQAQRGGRYAEVFDRPALDGLTTPGTDQGGPMPTAARDPVHCPKCSRPFSRPQGLSRHLTESHGVTKAKAPRVPKAAHRAKRGTGPFADVIAALTAQAEVLKAKLLDIAEVIARLERLG
jgi:uncharacterized C2H2 Zn-finger protein